MQIMKVVEQLPVMYSHTIHHEPTTCPKAVTEESLLCIVDDAPQQGLQLLVEQSSCEAQA